MTRKTFLLFYLLGCIFVTFAQEPAPQRQKVFRAWIKLNNNPWVAKGFLYQVNDSSVFLVNSLTTPESREYKFSTISLLKVRRNNSIARGTIIGSSVGFTSGVILVNSFGEGFSLLAFPVSVASGFTFGLIGAGMGAVFGTIKDRIPVRCSYDNFSKYKGSLLEYSWMRERITGQRFEHRGYLGTEMGFSFTGDEFIGPEDIPVASYLRMNKTGFVMVIDGGYRINKILGVDVSLIEQMYGVETTVNNNDNESYGWEFDALMISPVVTFPSSGRLLVSLSPGIGYAGTTLSDSKNFLLNGEGTGWQLRGSLKYNYSKRWLASLSSGYLASKLKYDEGGSGKPRTFHIEAGLAYKFGRKNLN